MLDIKGTHDPGVVLPAGASMLERLAAITRAERGEKTQGLPTATLQDCRYIWDWWARAGQRPPPGEWRTWLILAGRGFGKTRAGAEWVRMQAENDGRLRIALVASTMAEARAVMVEGESGIMAVSPKGKRPKYEPSLRRLRWENGAKAFLYSAQEPDSLRGAQHHLAWCDEIGKWPRAIDAWDNLAMGLRLGRDPRTVATTTPRGVALVKRLIDTPGVAKTFGRMTDNSAHLAPAFITMMRDQYAGTHTGRRELDGEMIEDVEGALWSRKVIEQQRIARAPDRLRRVVIGVDPPAGASDNSDACGIVVAALGEDGRAYVLADASVKGERPEGWARRVAAAAARWGADRVVAEANNGGAMVESVLRAAEAGLPVKLVHAAHGKSARAEPVSLLYASGRVFHAGAFPDLEDEMTGLMIGGSYEGPGRSPDRADALVWALTELMLGKAAKAPGVRLLG